jgi:WD40 repeat protein
MFYGWTKVAFLMFTVLKCVNSISFAQGSKPEIIDLDWSQKGYLAVGHIFEYVEIYDPKNQRAATLNFEGSLVAIAWNDTGNILAFADSTGTAQIWNLDTSASTSKLIGGFLIDIVWNPNGIQLAVATRDGLGPIEESRIHILDSSNLGEIFTLEINYYDYYLQGIAWNPLEQNQIALAGSDGLIRLWDIQTAKEVSYLLVDNDSTIKTNEYGDVIPIVVQPPTWSLDQQLLAAVDDKDNLWIWNTSTWDASTYNFGHIINDYEWSIDNKLACIVHEDSIKILDEELRLLESISTPNEWIRTVTWSPDGTKLAYGGQSGELHLVDITELENET